MNRLYSAFISGIFICCPLICFATAVEAPKQVGALTEKFTNKEKMYSIDYPADWQKREVPSIDFVLFAPPKGTDAQIHASMNVIAEKVNPPVTLNQFYTESVNNITTELKDVKMEGSGEATLNGTGSKWVLYSHKMQDISFKVLQYFIVVGERVYLLTFSALENDFATYRPDFDQIANSFHIIKDNSAPQPAPAPVSAP